MRESAAWALGRINDTKAIDPLIYRASRDEEESVRLIAAGSLVKLGRTEYFDQVIQGLNVEDKYLRATAAEMLGQIGDLQAVEPLIVALKDEDAYVRTCAATALGEIGDDRAINPLMEALETEADYSAKNMEQEALDKLGSM